MEDMLLSYSKQNQQERKAKPQQEQPQKCPRCDSINTKFCYYNNYSLSQPRYFCKSCRRYWTKGGTLRNVPVGGGCRKTKRPSPSLSNPKKTPSNPLLYDSGDLALAFSGLQKQPRGQLGFENHKFNSISGNPRFGNPNEINQPYVYQDGFYGNPGELEARCGEYYQMTTVKQEVQDFGTDYQSKILFGFSWNGGIGEFDYGRESSSWNNVIGINGPSSSSWHGVLNSVL